MASAASLRNSTIRKHGIRTPAMSLEKSASRQCDKILHAVQAVSKSDKSVSKSMLSLSRNPLFVMESADPTRFFYGRHGIPQPSQHNLKYMLITDSGCAFPRSCTTIVSNTKNIKFVLESAEFPHNVYGTLSQHLFTGSMNSVSQNV